MKKTWLVRTILAALLSCGMVFALASCSTNYTVSYSLGEHAADGAAAPESAEYEQGTQITLPEAPAAEDGWEFTAWSDGETTYDAGDSYTVEANVTFTATWEEVTTPEPIVEYTVTYVLGDHAASDATVPTQDDVAGGTQITLAAAPAAEDGWQFAGWSDGEKTYDAGDSFAVEANVTFTATWEEVTTPEPIVEYTVTYALGDHAASDATVPTQDDVAGGTQITLPEAPAAEDGWEFTAWSDGETTYDAGDSYTVEANVTFTAQWTEVTTPTPETYTVTFDANGGAFADEEETLVLSGLAEDSTIAETQVSTPTRKGYTFGGWYTAETEGTQVTLPVTVTGTATYYAHWTAQTYSVTYVMNGGAEIAAGSYTYGVGMNLPTPATRTGYTFAGWYATSDFSGNAVTLIGTTETGDKTFYAKWTLVTYDITYSGLEGGTHSNPTTYDVEDSDITLTAASRDGYRFDGWYDAQTGGNKVETIDVSEAVDVTLYARWTQLFTVTYAVGANAADGATAPAAVQVEDGESVTLPAGDNIPAAATGYHFDGWYVEGTKIEGTTYTPAADVTITATYVANIYTVAFDDNVDDSSVTGTMASQPFTYGTAQNLTDNAFTRTGYTFSGWATSADGTVAYDDEESVNNLTAENNVTVTLYAVWTANTYTVTLDYNYENAPADVTITVTFGSTFGAGTNWPTADPVRDGFTFMGWWTANDGTGTQYTGATQVTTEAANLTLYAHWSATAVSVTFEYNDGTDGSQTIRVQEGGSVDLSQVTEPTRTGYRFDGWYTEATNGTKVEFPITDVTEAIIYYAHWTQVWTVSVDGATVATLAKGETYDLSEPDAQTDKTFMGWAVDGEIVYTTTDNTVTMGEADIVLTAVWAEHSAIKSEAELLAVLADATADEITLADNIEMTTSGIDIRRDISIDLNEKTITFTTPATAAAADRIRLTAYGTSYNDRIEVTITNGALDFNTNANPNIDGSASMIFTQNVDLTMDSVTVTSDAMGLFIACGKLNMTDCTVTAVGAYAIGTNASISEGSELYGPVDMTISDSTLTAEFNGGAGLLFNVAGSLTLTNTQVKGGRQGVILRSGTATITGGSITSAWTDPDTDSYIDSWGSGTAVPMAALVIGDISAGVYKNNTSVTISGTQVTVTGTPESARYIYIAGDATDGTKATLTYACNDEYMTALADTNGIIVANDSASVVVTHSETYVEEQEATCTEDGHAAYYQCSICEKYFDAEYNETTLEELKTDDKLGHEYDALVYDSKTGVVSISCARNDLTISATVTILGGDATGTLVLAAENFVFNQDTQTFTLTLPANAYDAPTGKYFGGWLVPVANDDDEVYQPNATVTIENGATITITAHWLDYSAENPLEIGTPDNTLVYTGDIPIWEGTISQGETVTFTGTMTSAAQQNWQTVLMYLWSETVTGQFRIDNAINYNQQIDYSQTYLPTEGWIALQTVTPTYVIDGENAYLLTIADCAITITYDWSNSNVIYLTIQAVRNNGDNTQTMTYKIIPDGANFGVTEYNIGLGGEASYTVINSITVTEHAHSYTDSVCTVCGQVDPEHSHTYVSGVCSVCGTHCRHDGVTAIGQTCPDCQGVLTADQSLSETCAAWDWGNHAVANSVLVVRGSTTTISLQYAGYSAAEWACVMFSVKDVTDTVSYYALRYIDHAYIGNGLWTIPHYGQTCTPSGDMVHGADAYNNRPNRYVKATVQYDENGTMTITIQEFASTDANMETPLGTSVYTITGLTATMYRFGFGTDVATVAGNVTGTGPAFVYSSES